MITLNENDWNTYQKKYGKLIWKIAHMISGDSMLASVEDNYSDLCIAAMESINGYHKKTGQSFEEMIGSKLFDQYTKTCLWTAKARKGIKLSERIPFRNKHVSIDSMMDDPTVVFDIQDTSSTARFSKVEVLDMYNSYDIKIKKLIDLLQANPDLMTESGDLKLEPIARSMNLSVARIKKLINVMEKKNEPC